MFYSLAVKRATFKGGVYWDMTPFNLGQGRGIKGSKNEKYFNINIRRKSETKRRDIRK
jgi:hypothetical protein